MSKSEKIPTSLIILLLFFVTVLGLFLLVNRQKIQPQETQTTISPSTRLSLITDDVKTLYRNGEKVEVLVIADSAGHDIVGYDILLAYDKEAFRFIGATSESDVFDLYSRDSETHLSLTGVKKLAQNEPTVFKNNPIVRLTFTAVSPGEHKLSIVPSLNLEETKMVNGNTKVFSPTIENIEVEVN